MTHARIYRPDKNPMQSGKAKMREWVLEYVPQTAITADPLMGWNAMQDTLREIRLEFPSKEAAIAYAEKKKIAYEVIEPKPRKIIKKSYADNFKATAN